MIVRKYFLDQLFALLGQFPVVGIIGARQVGKTTLAQNLMYDKHSIYLDLESDIDQTKLANPGYFLRNYQEQLIILDEIQTMPHLFPLLRALVDEHRIPARFLILGSASPSLIRGTSESLAGRIAYRQLMPLTLPELTDEMRYGHWLRGGFPLSFTSIDDNQSFQWRKQFLRTYIERDLPLLGLDTDVRTLNAFVRMLAAQVGQLWNASSFARSLGVTHPVIKKYMDYLEHAFLIHVLEPYYSNIKKRLVKSPKIYFQDTGMLHALANIVTLDELRNNILVGQSWENYVIAQIMHVLGDEYQYHFYRTHEGTEADLVLVSGNKPLIAIEIKYTNAPRISKGFTIAIDDLKTEKNYVITPGSDTYGISPGITVTSLATFLDHRLDLQ